jgi:LEA14-like dessication related protein
MNLLLALAAAGAAAYFLSLGKTAKSASQLMYDFKKLKILKSSTKDGLVLRLYFNITNPNPTKVLIQMIALTMYLDNSKLGTIAAQNISIPANAVNQEKYIDVRITWANLIIAIGSKATQYFINRTLTVPEKITLKGTVRAENITISVNKEIPFSFNS